jgi:hypothetical protein
MTLCYLGPLVVAAADRLLHRGEVRGPDRGLRGGAAQRGLQLPHGPQGHGIAALDAEQCGDQCLEVRVRRAGPAQGFRVLGLRV